MLNTKRNITLGIVAACTAAASAFALNGNADSYCENIVSASDTHVFTVSSDMVSQMSPPAGLTTADLIRYVDTIVQRIMRNSRARQRTRVDTTTTTACDPNGFNSCITSNGDEDSMCNRAEKGPCIFGICGINEICSAGQCYAVCTDSDDCEEEQICSSGRCEFVDPAAWASCNPLQSTACTLVVCHENTDFSAHAMSGDGGGAAAIVEHELTHVYGLGHVEEMCATSDGCEGERMCDQLGGGPWTYGDGRGMRNRYGDQDAFLTRRLARFEWEAVGNSVPSEQMTVESSRTSAFPQRVACASGSSPLFRCAVARATISSGSRVLRVAGMNPGNTVAAGATFGTFIEIPFAYGTAPDITLDPTGRYAWVAVTKTVSTGQVWVLRVDLQTNDVTMLHVPREGTSSDHLRPMLPPRISWVAAWDAAALFTYGDPDGARHQFAIRTVSSGATPLISQPLSFFGTDFDLDGVDSNIIADYDVDCRVASSTPSTTTTDCVIVAPRLPDPRESTFHAAYDGKLSSRRVSFTKTLTSVFPSPTYSYTKATGAWTAGDETSTNAVIGVAFSPTRLLISGSQRVLTTNSSNTLMRLFSGTDIAVSLDTDLLDSDAQFCETGNAVFPPATSLPVGGKTMHGGTSLAWCPTCGSGRFIGYGFGARSTDDAFCF